MSINFGFIWVTCLVLVALNYINILSKRAKKSPMMREAALKVRANASWARCNDSHYIFPFREKLDAIATYLSREYGTNIYTHFNGRYAEFCTLRGGVLVNVLVKGEGGAPYLAIVTAPRIPESVRGLFEALMPGKVTFKGGQL